MVGMHCPLRLPQRHEVDRSLAEPSAQPHSLPRPRWCAPLRNPLSAAKTSLLRQECLTLNKHCQARHCPQQHWQVIAGYLVLPSISSHITVAYSMAALGRAQKPLSSHSAVLQGCQHICQLCIMQTTLHEQQVLTAHCREVQSPKRSPSRLSMYTVWLRKRARQA